MKENGHQTGKKSRADFIKEARESCARNLNPAAKGVGKRSFRKPDFTYKNINIGDDQIHISPLKKLLIKFLFAFAIFIAVLTISSLDTRYETSYGEKIHTWITSDASVERAEDFFVSLLEKINNK